MNSISPLYTIGAVCQRVATMEGADMRWDMRPGAMDAIGILEKNPIHDIRCHGWGGKIEM